MCEQCHPQACLPVHIGMTLVVTLPSRYGSPTRRHALKGLRLREGLMMH